MQLNELAPERTVVIYPGRFSPFHIGHANTWRRLADQYGKDNVFVVTSNKINNNAPFSFDDKVIMMIALGIPRSQIVLSAQPYKAIELCQTFNTERTQLIVAVGEKDMLYHNARFTFKPNKDGKPSYYQEWTEGAPLEPMCLHGYIKTMPNIKFVIDGERFDSANEIRHQWISRNTIERQMFLSNLYGDSSDHVYNVFDQNIKSIVGSDITTAYIDLDGVLADFFGEWSRLSGQNHYKDIDDREQKLQLVREHPDFWENLPLMNNTFELVTMVNNIFGSYTILSKPLEGDAKCIQGKKKWVETHLAFCPPRELIFAADKSVYATKLTKPNLLIDDYKPNVESWRKAGGIAIRYKDDAFDKISRQLDAIATNRS
jgi:5'(3')-deoxyribonucleotidase